MPRTLSDRPFMLFRSALRAGDLLLAGLIAERLHGSSRRLEQELDSVANLYAGTGVSLLSLRVLARLGRILGLGTAQD